MGSEWPVVSLGSLAANVPNALVGGPFGSNLLAGDRVETGVPVIQGANMSSGRWLGGELVFVSEEKANSLSANIARYGDIIFTQRGTVGQVALVPETYPRFVVSQSQMKLTPNPMVTDVQYLYYYFSAPAQVAYIKSNAIQTGVPHTNLGILRESPVTLPALSEQCVIASILGALDDKIELNRKMSRTLDETAQTVFQSMFSRIGDEADQAPEPPAKFESLATMTKGRSYKSAELAPSDTALVTLKSFLRFGGYRPDGLKSYTGSCKPEQVIEPGEIVVALTDVTQAADVIGNPAIVLPDAAYRILIASLDTAIVRPTEGVPKSFVYFLMRTPAFKQHARAHTTGTTVLHLNPKHLLAYSVGDVDLAEARSFDVTVSPMLDRLRLCAAESVALEGLRDTLLPRLLSGELRVRDAEAIVEQVV